VALTPGQHEAMVLWAWITHGTTTRAIRIFQIDLTISFVRGQ
jgi:hypothetical protein